MKKILILLIILIGGGNIIAQDTNAHNPRLRLGLDEGWMQVGLVDGSTLRHTDYNLVALRPEIRIARHWGLSISCGFGNSIHNNLNNGRYNPLAQYRNIYAQLTPYYEWQWQRWELQIGVGASMRVRFAYMSGEPCSFGKTGAFGLVVQPRGAYRINDHLFITASLTMSRTFLDIIDHYTRHPEYSRTSGLIGLSAGIRWEF